jgi:hypothetical protein
MFEDLFTLKLAMDRILGVRDRTEDLVVRDLLQQAVNLLETADALISALDNSKL